MFELFKHPNPGVGSRVTVSIDYKKQVVKRQFLVTATLVNGQTLDIPESEQESLFQNEVYWLERLAGTLPIPPVIEVDVNTRTIIQRYFGPDLLIRNTTSEFKWSQNLSEQLVNGYQIMYEMGVCKRNGSLSNLTLDLEGNLIFFDFKWAFSIHKPPPSLNPLAMGKSAIDDEKYSLDNYLKKIDPEVASDISRIFDQKIAALLIG